jgi:Ca2+-binding EF-hand superfamily protein
MQRAFPLALAALLGAVFAAPALAQDPQAQGQQPPPNPAEAFIKQHDTDGDGKVSQAEAVAPQEARFKELDADGDGLVTADEFRQAFEAKVPSEARQKMKERGLPDPGEGFLKELDQNEDGNVNLAESQTPTVNGFKRMDSDGDGFATLEEADAFFRKMWEEIRQMHEQQEGQPPAQ